MPNRPKQARSGEQWIDDNYGHVAPYLLEFQVIRDHCANIFMPKPSFLFQRDKMCLYRTTAVEIEDAFATEVASVWDKGL